MIPPLHILALDPGCTRNGYARITLHRDERGGRLLFNRGGHRELDRGWLTAELQQLREEGGVFALEVLIGGRFFGRMTSTLNETAAMEGRILEIAEAAGWPIPPRDPLPMVEQKGVFVLKLPAGDGSIKRVVGTERVRSEKSGRSMTRTVKQLVKIHGWRGELCHSPRASNKMIAAVVERTFAGGVPYFDSRSREHVYDAAGLAIVACSRHLGAPVQLSPATEAALLLAAQAEREKTSKRLYSKATRAAIGARSKATHARAGR